MENLTIDQILAQSRDEHPDTFDVKEASAQSIVSNSVTGEEIEKMAGLLKEAALPEAKEESFNEKLAQALLLNETIQSLSTSETSNEESEKIAEFRESAISAGHKPEEVDGFIEKHAGAGMTMWGSLVKSLKGKPGKALAATAALGAAGGGGKIYGEASEKKKRRPLIRGAFGLGRRVQHIRDVSAFKRHLAKRQQGQ